MDWCIAPDRGLVKPDLTFYIDVAPEIIAKRGEFGVERYEKEEFQKKVGEAYGKLRDLNKGDEHWVNVQADDRSVEEIHSEILERVVKYLEEAQIDQSDLKRMESALFQEPASGTTTNV